jgi:Ala-tRNA(Pro) deacylase
MPVKKLKQFLDSENVRYVSIVHSEAYTAQEVAESVHVSGKAMAKTIIVELDGKMAMVVLPADRKIVIQDLRDVTGTDRVRFASEEAFQERFPSSDSFPIVRPARCLRLATSTGWRCMWPNR